MGDHDLQLVHSSSSWAAIGQEIEFLSTGLDTRSDLLEGVGDVFLIIGFHEPRSADARKLAFVYFTTEADDKDIDRRFFHSFIHLFSGDSPGSIGSIGKHNQGRKT